MKMGTLGSKEYYNYNCLLPWDFCQILDPWVPTLIYAMNTGTRMKARDGPQWGTPTGKPHIKIVP